MTRASRLSTAQWRTGFVLLCLCVALMATPASGSRRTDKAADELRRQRVTEILKSMDPDAARDAATPAPELAAQGTLAIPILLELLETQELPATEDTESQPLTSAQTETLFEAFDHFPGTVVRMSLDAWRIKRDGERVRYVALRIMGQVGKISDLDFMIRLATPGDDMPDLTYGLATQFQDSVTWMLRREEKIKHSIGARLINAHDATRESLIRALGSLGTVDALEILATLLGFEPSLDQLLLNQIWQAAQATNPVVGDRTLDSIRPFLEYDDASLAREAIHALGYLNDFESADAMVELLRSESAEVQKGSLWALHRMSGLKLPANHARWTAWLRNETKWYYEEAPKAFDRLEHRKPAEVVKGINEITQHRYRRHDLALRLTRALEHPNQAVRHVGCVALGQMGSSAAAPALIDRLGDGDDVVVQAAWKALKTITGRSLPLDPKAWREELGLGDFW